MVTEPKRDPDVEKLQVCFKVRLMEILADMIHEGHDPVVFEAVRSQARQEYLWTLGRRGRPGEKPVTWTKNSRHRMGIAADVISAKRGWTDSHFFKTLARLARL